MALILNLETATTNCSVGISDKEKTIFLKENNAATYSHSEHLHVFIQEVLSEASLSFSDLDAIAVSKGPGSYTGLRIGVSAAKGLCFSLDIPLISVSTLQSMAMQVYLEKPGSIIPVLDARRMEVYAAIYDQEYKEVRETWAEIIDENSFKETLKTELVHIVGSGATKIMDVISHPNVVFDDSLVPSAKQMAPLAFQKFNTGNFEDVAYFEPFYLKDFVLQGKKN